jgi:hypothetical protein
LIFDLKTGVLKDMSLQSRGEKPPAKFRRRQLILALEKFPLNGQMPSGVRSKCVTLIAELLRSVIFKNLLSERSQDE